MSSSAAPRLPAPLAAFLARFPLKKHPRIPLPPNEYRPVKSSTLWLSPPLDGTDLLSADVECLKWQAYIALRGLKDIRVRFDVSPEGALEGRLPNIHVPLSESVLPKDDTEKDGDLLASQMIPTWVDARLGVDSSADENEGYLDESAKDESRAWVSLLEGTVHAALILSQPKPAYWYTLLFPPTKAEHRPVASLLTPPPAPLTGYLSLLPPWGTRISHSAIMAQYRDAIASLSERLGTDKWFLGSAEPTPLDALAFAYLHCILHSSDAVRIEVTKRVNLVAWEWRVRGVIRGAFIQ
ncbi:hypothetical protein AGABI1DRAFT_111105 [Agaricus bisporus var. burnettii JB137-S8]|uniref:Metaxin glutathione S-transferase domain-containing protein n=1 Tax=Agaricus bisporus var. burnettii (strain JB137-S8 / ATCC MYA-4627 / FGSC 10392) TaxID=597362 RepID=K5X3S6_AGABU|nr:uncharacterized protein AGABI1DRAFT_111105 [Agaricus bisporus var. burnettii JB137-S8]EKM82491.1 hypothetical protein AGABI1DRAFT_111105 [Agaricus bisporus var. burnettii JB137-S8]